MESAVFDYIISFGSLLLTVALVYCTYNLWRSTETLAQQSELSREHEKTPRLSAKLKLIGLDSQYIELVICNVGKGVAFNVSFELEGLDEHRQRCKISLQGNETPINFLAPNETESYGFCMVRDVRELDPQILPAFRVKFEYANSGGALYKNDCHIDIRQYEGVTWWGQHHEGSDTILNTLHGPLRR